MPTLVATPCPSGPVVVSTPDVQRYSGCPGHLLSSCRKRFISSRLTDTSPNLSYFALTALTWARNRVEYSSIEAWPADNTKRSRLGKIGSSGSKLRNRCQRQYMVGAIAIGVPGWPEFAFWIASIESVRMVLMHN